MKSYLILKNKRLQKRNLVDNLLLTEITLQDYSVYRGKNTFDFTCSPDKPIIVIGGENVAGKTTFFEFLMLCLYVINGHDCKTILACSIIRIFIWTSIFDQAPYICRTHQSTVSE